MSMTLGDALVYLGAKRDGLDRDLEEAHRSTTGWASAVSAGIGIALGGAIFNAVGEGIQAVGRLGKSVIDFSADSRKAVGYLQAELGTTAEEADILGQIARNVWKNNFGEDVLDAAAGVGLVRQQLNQLNAEAIQAVTETGFAVRDTFGTDMPKYVDAMRVLMEDFNLTHQQAMDFIVSGYQRGLDRSGDFLESITEYAPQFRAAEVGAAGFFSAMETGLQGGVLGTDKALDMFKEFRVRLLDGSTATAQGLQQIGLSVDDITRGINDGSLTWGDAFTMVRDELRSTTDQATVMQAGVALLGTQFEDMGVQAALSVDLASTSLEDMAGAADSVRVRYNTLGDFMQGMGRRLTAALSPISDALLEVANDAVPGLEAAFQNLEANVIPIAAGIGAIFKAMAGLAKSFFQGFRRDTGDELGGTAEDAGSWGRNIVMQLARGMASAATAVVRVLAQIGSLIAGLLKPGSPPKLLPEIDQWGTAAMQEFINGMAGASVDALRGMGSRIMETLGGIQEAGLVSLFSTITGTIQRVMESSAGEGDQGLIGRIMGNRGVIAEAISDIQRYGSVTDQTLSAIQQSMVSLPPVANDYVQAMLRLYQANQAVADAQEEINRVTQEYDDQLSPLRAELEGIRDAQANAADEKRIAALKKAIARGALNDEQKAQALEEIRARELQVKIRSLEDEKKTAVDAAQEKLDAAEAEQQAAQDAVDLQQALIDAGQENNDLIREQISLLDQLAGTMAGIGESIASAVSGALGGGLGAGDIWDAGAGDDPLGLTSLLDSANIDQLVADIMSEFDPLKLEIEGLGDIWGTVGERWNTWWAENGPAITGIANGVWTAVKEYALGQFTALSHGLTAWKALFQGDFETFGSEMTLMWVTMWNNMVNFLTNLWTLAEPYLSTWWTALQTWFDETDWAALANLLMQRIIEALALFWTLAVATINRWWTAYTVWFDAQDWKGLGFKIVYGILDSLAKFWETAVPTVETWWESFKTWFDETDWLSLGEKIVDGVVDGLRAYAGRLAGAMISVAQGALDAWNEFWDNRSPSHLMEANAGQIATGAMIGLRNAQDMLAREMTALGEAAFGGWQSATGAAPATAAPAPGPGVYQFLGDVKLADDTAVEAWIAWLAGLQEADSLGGVPLSYAGA